MKKINQIIYIAGAALLTMVIGAILSEFLKHEITYWSVRHNPAPVVVEGLTFQQSYELFEMSYYVGYHNGHKNRNLKKFVPFKNDLRNDSVFVMNRYWVIVDSTPQLKK